MSFFDEVDEPPATEIRTSSRSAPRRSSSRGGGGGSRGSGSGSRPPRRRPPAGNTQSVRIRQGVAIAALIVVIVLIAVGVNSCQNSANKSAVQDYGNDVNSVITSSQSSSKALFKILRGGLNSSNAATAEQSINQVRQSVQSDLSRAQRFSVPGAAKTANAHLLLALQERLNGVAGISAEIQPALATSDNKQAIETIAGEMAQFYSSDVIYKQYAAPELVAALHGQGITVGGDGVTVNSGQFLPSIKWLDPTSIADVLNVTLPSTGGAAKNGSNGLRGHELTSVSVGGETLSTTSTNTVTASPAPTFTFSFTNSGNFDESGVRCNVTVSGAGDVGNKIVPETFAGKTSSCAVTLKSVPKTGTYSVVATVEKVPGEKNTSNNTLTFSVAFQ